jgi:hypothetical protein
MAASRGPALRGLAEQGARQRVDAHQLAAKRHQVQVGLQDLVLAPAPLQHLGGHGLPSFCTTLRPPLPWRQSPSSRPASCMVMVEAPRVRVPQVGPGGGRDGRQSTPLCS